MRNLLRVSTRHVCPSCLVGPLFAHGYELNVSCPVCGLDLIGRDGAQYGGPMVLGYTLGGTVGLLTVLSVILVRGSASAALWSGLAATVATIFLTWRHCKAAWTWLLFRTGQLDRRDSASKQGLQNRSL
jgi:uncharacterized protein (DUF983 family)